MASIIMTTYYDNLFSFFLRIIRYWNILPFEYRQLKEKTFKKELYKEIELKNTTVVNPKEYDNNRKTNGPHLPVF